MFMTRDFALFSDKMVFIKPDIEAGTIQDQADLVTPAQYPEPDTDEEPDVEEIEVCVTCCVFLKKWLLNTHNKTGSMKSHNPSCEIQQIKPSKIISKVNCEGNTSNGVNENISKVLEVYDEETCLETMRGEIKCI